MSVSLSSSCLGRAWVTVAMMALVAAVPSRAAAQSAAPPAGQPAVEAMLTELRTLVTEQRALIDGQAERIGALEKDLAALKQAQAGVPTAPAVAPSPQAAQDAQRQPEMPKEVVSAGDFPGSIRIPGTDSAIKFGGQARMTLVHTLGPLGTEDRFVTSSIPVGSDQQAGENARTVYSPSPSRFGHRFAHAVRADDGQDLHRGRLRRQQEYVPSPPRLHADQRAGSSVRRGRRSPIQKPSRSGSTSRG